MSEADEQQEELFPEYVPDYTDSAVWIRVETPELIRLGRGNDEGREVLSGRMLVSYRWRTPEDGTAEVIREQPTSTQRVTEEKVEWPSWGDGGRVDPRIRNTPSRNWAWAGDNRNAAYYDWRDSQEKNR